MGETLRVDDQGFLVSRASAGAMQSPWREAVAELTERYSVMDGFGLYVRGSVANGTAVPGISDLDYIVLLAGPVDAALIDAWDADLAKRHRGISKVDRLEIQWEGTVACLGEPAAFLLSCQSSWVSGEDITPLLPRFAPGRSTRLNSRGFDGWLDARLDKLDGRPAHPVAADGCTWMMKWLLRVGFELVMERDRSYTRDLYPCWDRFIHYYPERREQMWGVLDWALNPITDRLQIRDVVGDLGGFLRDELRAINYLDAGREPAESAG